ncbi:VWA domain-containing protein [Schumannella sp. 10F1B-5-1]|nr:VWA domain-containing protein [Schumannella sp. 10F1B-5-1]
MPPELAPAWEEAQELWGVRLHPAQIEPKAGQPSFAWFGFPPQVTVDPVEARRVGADREWATVFAHEIGHHVLSPSTRIASLKIRQQMARALVASSFEAPHDLADRAALMANLWSDMLINVRVAEMQAQRDARDGVVREPGMIRLWRLLSTEPPGRLFWVVLRAYEHLWDLPDGSLVPIEPPAAPPPPAVPEPSAARATAVAERFREQQAKLDAATAEAERAHAELLALTRTHPEADARLLARTVRTFGDDPIRGALRAGMILAPYLLEADRAGGGGGRGSGRGRPGRGGAGDAGGTGVPCAGEIGSPDPTEAELGEVLRDARLSETPQHPALEAGGGSGASAVQEVATSAGAPAASGGQGYGLAQTLELYGPAMADRVLRAWYLDGARRWVTPLREPAVPEPTGEQIPGPTEIWGVDDELTAVDWRATLAAAPRIVPGVTTRRRTWLDDDPPVREEGIDLDLWVDSSGSMPRPSADSPALLAGAILLESVLAGGGRVQVTSFSGPGQVAGLERPTRNRSEAIGALLHYFGGGTTFPLDLLGRRYREQRRRADRRRHLVVLSDGGLESLFGRGQDGLEHVAGEVRAKVDTATLLVIGWLGDLPALARTNGYTLEHIATHADAPAACRRLAATIVRTAKEDARD